MENINYNSDEDSEELDNEQINKENHFDFEWENIKKITTDIKKYEKYYYNKKIIQKVNMEDLFTLLYYNELPQKIIDNEKLY